MRRTARGCAVDPHPGRHWCGEAANQLRVVTPYCLPDLHLTQGQLDERYAVRRALKDGPGSEDEALERLVRAPHGVWRALAPERQGGLARTGGERTLAWARRGGHHVAQVWAPDGAPRFVTDGFRESLPAVRPHSGPWG
jgi:hypothetical protein